MLRPIADRFPATHLPPEISGVGAAPAAGAASLPAAARPRWHDITIVRKRKCAWACVEAVPPEEFGIARHAKSIREADYCFHEVLRSQATLIEQGYDAEQVRKLPSQGATVSSETADVVVVVDQADRIPLSVAVGRRSLRIARQSVVFGLGLSVGAMVVAAFGYLPPVWGALFQEVIDVAVILNALRALRP